MERSPAPGAGRAPLEALLSCGRLTGRDCNGSSTASTPSCKPTASIGLVSYTLRGAAWQPAGQPIRSNLAVVRVTSSRTTLNQLIWNVVRQSQIGPDELQIIDLSAFASVAAQMAHLRG
jgi:hypothetical protein